jgi:hypothetical protein
MSVTITPTIQSLIDWLKTDTRIIDVTVDTVTSATIELLPASMSEPLLFSVAMQIGDSTGVGNLVISSSQYNQTTWLSIDKSSWMPVTPEFVDQIWTLTNFDNTSTFGLTTTNTTAFYDPITQILRPIFGFDYTPVEVSTTHAQLQTLVSMLSTVTNTVQLYKYISKDVLAYLDTDEAYYTYCYFGTGTFTTFLGGKDAIGIAITKNDYLGTSTHQLLVDRVVERIAEYKVS